MSTEFLINFQQQMSGANMASELAQLGAEIKNSIAKIRDLESESLSAQRGLDKVAAAMLSVRSRMQEAMSAGDEKAFWKAAGAMNELTAKQDALKKKALEVKNALDAEKTSVTAMAKDYGGLQLKGSGDVEDAAKGFKKLGGPLGKVGNLVEDVSEGFTMLEGSIGATGAIAAVGAAAFAAAAVAVLALAAAVLIGAGAAAKWVVSLADARREVQLTIEGVQIADGALTDLSGTIASVQRATGAQTDRLLDLTQQLRAAGITAEQLPTALEAIANADIGNPKASAQLISDLKAGTKGYQDLLAAGSKYEDLVARKQIGLTALWERFQRNISDIFGDINIEPLLEGMRLLVDLFDKNTESGRALKALLETIFGPLEDSKPIFQGVERGFLMVEIAALEVAIVMKQVADYATVLEVAFGALAIVAALLGIVVGVVVLAGLALVVLTFITLAIVLAPIAALVYGAVEAFQAMWNLVGEGDWGGIGMSIIDGILNPFGDTSKISGALKTFSDAFVNEAKSVFKIASPSALLEDKIGENLALGVTGPVEEAVPDLNSSLESMGSSKGGGRGGGGSKTISGNTFIFHGVKDAEQAEDTLLDKLIEILDGEGDEQATEAPT